MFYWKSSPSIATRQVSWCLSETRERASGWSTDKSASSLTEWDHAKKKRNPENLLFLEHWRFSHFDNHTDTFYSSFDFPSGHKKPKDPQSSVKGVYIQVLFLLVRASSDLSNSWHNWDLQVASRAETIVFMNSDISKTQQSNKLIA